MIKLGSITTGGGFSNYYLRTKPAFQNDAINNYLQKLQGTNKDPITGYNTQGRGYPDIGTRSTFSINTKITSHSYDIEYILL
jgi:hypothetical protein